MIAGPYGCLERCLVFVFTPLGRVDCQKNGWTLSDQSTQETTTVQILDSHGRRSKS